MKTLFVNPPNDNPMTDLKAIEPPVWCAILAGKRREEGHDVVIWDAEVDPLIPELHGDEIDRIVLVVMGSNPSVSSTPKMPAALQLAEQLGGKGISICLSGLHPMTYVGQKEYPWVEYFPLMEELTAITQIG